MNQFIIGKRYGQTNGWKNKCGTNEKINDGKENELRK